MNTTLHRRQTKAREYMRTLSLVVMNKGGDKFSLPLLSPYFQLKTTKKTAPTRNINLFLKIMAVNRVVIRDIEDGGYPNLIAVAYFLDDTTNAVVAQNIAFFSLTGVHTTDDYVASAETAVTAYATTQGYTLSAGIIWSSLSTVQINALITTALSTFAGAARSFSSPSLAVNTARQASTTRDADVTASVDITTALSLTGGAAGKVTLQYADNNTFTTNLVTVSEGTTSNTGTLTIGLALSQIGTAVVKGIIPANKYYRLLTTNVTGTPTYGTPLVQEVLL